MWISRIHVKKQTPGVVMQACSPRVVGQQQDPEILQASRPVKIAWENLCKGNKAGDRGRHLALCSDLLCRLGKHLHTQVQAPDTHTHVPTHTHTHTLTPASLQHTKNRWEEKLWHSVKNASWLASPCLTMLNWSSHTVLLMMAAAWQACRDTVLSQRLDCFTYDRKIIRRLKNNWLCTYMICMCM